MDVLFFPEAEAELARLPPGERAAMAAAIEKLETFGDRLSYPHSSAVEGVGATLRELRPRAGRSPWRAFYRRVGDVMVVAAIGPEAKSNPNGFRRATTAALDRLNDDVRLVEIRL